MMFEIDLGDIGIYDAEITAQFERVRGYDEVSVHKVEIVLPIEFEGREGVCVNVVSLISDSVMQDLVDAFLLNYHQGID
jgi:hypothetical protein